MVQKMEEWIASYEEGRIFREGVSCAIIGKTNVGKSSLLNVLLKEDRAIVTPVPGNNEGCDRRNLEYSWNTGKVDGYSGS